jgi:hypothetical protein
MAWYRKTTPSSYPNTPASNFTDTSKNWRQYKNLYRYTSGLETASLTAVPGRYTDDTRTWRRIKAMYRFKANGTWQKVFGKFAGQPYPETPAKIRYTSYTGLDVGQFAMMGPGSEAIAQGETGTTFLWGRDGQDWQNIENLTSRSRTFVFSDRPFQDIAQQVTNDEGNFDGDKLRNSEAVILQYDGQYVWYRDRITVSGSTGTSYSQPVKIIKQQPVINSLAFKTSNTVAAGSSKYITYSIANQWYRSVNQYTSILKWYILDTQYETPTETKLLGSTTIYSTSPTETTTALTGEDYFSIPTTFGGVTTTGKWLHVRLICKNSSSDTDVDYFTAPYNDVTDYIVAQISGAVPIGTAGTVTMTRTNTSYTVSVSDANRGTWSNTPTSYRYQWYRRIQYDGANYAWTPISGATSATYDASTYKPTDNSSGYTIIVPVVWASNAAGESNDGYALDGFTLGSIYDITSTLGGITISSPDSVNNRLRYKLPSITTFTITKGARKITYVANFTADDPAVTTGTISWTGQAISNFAVNSSADTFTYQPLAAGTYNFTLTVTNSGANALSGSATATQNSIVVDDFSSYTFAFGNTFYVSTNGLIYLDVARGTTVPDGTSQRVIQIFPRDLNQGSNGAAGATGDGFLLRWSDANNYVVRYDGYVDGFAGTASYRLTYYVRFYKDQKYCDVYIENKGANVGSPNTSSGFYFDGSVLGASLANPAQGSTFRIYTDGQTGSLVTDFKSDLPVPADMVSAGPATGFSANFPPADEGYTAITTAANLYTSPTVTIGTVTSNATSISVPYTSGGSFAKFDIDVKTTSHNGASISGYPKTDQTTSTPITISSLSGNTTYYITITPKNSKGQTGTAQQTSKATTTAPGDLTNVVLKSFTNGYLRLFAKTGTNTDSIDYYTYRYNPSIFSVERVPATGYVNFATSSSTSYYIGQIDVSTRSSNVSLEWNSSLLPNNGSTTGNFATSNAALATGADNPSVTYTSTAGDGSISLSSIALAGAANYYTVDVKTVSQSGTSISGYPKVQQTSATQTISSLTNGTAYYIRITPYYYYTVDTTTDSSSIRYAGSAVDKTTTPASPPGTFTDLTYKEMYTGGFAAVFYTVSDTTAVTNFDANATRFYPNVIQTGGIVNYTASKRGFIAIYFGGFSDYQNTSYKWTGQMTPKKGTVSGTTQYIYSMTSKSTGTPADLPGVTLGTVTVGDGTLSVPVTLDANASRYTAILTRGTTTVSTKYLQSSTTLSYSGLTNGSSHTISVTPYYVYYTDPDATADDVKTTIQFPGTAVAKTGTPAAAAAAKPATPSAPSVTYKGTRNSRTYTWDVSYTIATDATSMDVMNQYFTSNSGTYTSSPYDTDPSGTQTSTYSGYIEYRNFVSSKAMPLTDADGYWDNNNSWMRARVRARNASGSSGWSDWSPWR